MGLNGVAKRQKRNFRPQNTPILNGGFRADVVSTRIMRLFNCALRESVAGVRAEAPEMTTESQR